MKSQSDIDQYRNQRDLPDETYLDICDECNGQYVGPFITHCDCPRDELTPLLLLDQFLATYDCHDPTNLLIISSDFKTITVNHQRPRSCFI